MATVKLTKENFIDEVMGAGVPVLIDFYADWCGPCKMLGPVIEELSNEYTDIKFAKVNVDDNMDLAEKFSIMSIPQVYMFKDGEVIGKFSGYRDKGGVKAFRTTS